MVHKKIQQITGVPHIQGIAGTPCEHEPHHTAYGKEAMENYEKVVEGKQHHR